MIYIFYPSKKTLTISVTGGSCTLLCNHCSAFYLKGMLTENQALEIIEANPGKYNSALISGGSDIEGRVPILEHLSFIKRLHKMGIKLNIHTGLISEREIFAIKPFFERISFDFVYDNNVIRDVYHLSGKNRDDFEKTYLLLRRLVGGKIESEKNLPSTRVVPHITVGLNCGKVSDGDFETIEELAYIKPALLVVDVFIPTKGTPFEGCPIPQFEKVEELFSMASRRLTNTILFLGCMRPHGKYREKLDIMAYEKGFKGFVLPSKKLVDKIKENGEEIVRSDECCALI